MKRLIEKLKRKTQMPSRTTTRALGLNSVMYFVAQQTFREASNYLAGGPHSGKTFRFEDQPENVKSMWAAIGLAAIRAHQLSPFKPMDTAPQDRPILIYVDGEWRRFFASGSSVKTAWHSNDGYMIPHADAVNTGLVWCEFPSTPSGHHDMTVQTRHVVAPNRPSDKTTPAVLDTKATAAPLKKRKTVAGSPKSKPTVMQLRG